MVLVYIEHCVQALHVQSVIQERRRASDPTRGRPDSGGAPAEKDPKRGLLSIGEERPQIQASEDGLDGDTVEVAKQPQDITPSQAASAYDANDKDEPRIPLVEVTPVQGQVRGRGRAMSDTASLDSQLLLPPQHPSQTTSSKSASSGSSRKSSVCVVQ